ncbi:MAG: hypothetical protein JWO72_1647, partial [Caulobacteraceae bacterium]|nr:hypothetical protein [Caulobacteraceae bacterium]
MVVAGYGPQRIAAAVSDHALREAVESELQRAHPPLAVLVFYQARDYQPLWLEPSGFWPPRAALRPEAAQWAANTGLAAAGRSSPAAAARAEVALSLALEDDVSALRRPARGVRLAFVDPDLAPPADPREVLEQAARAPSLGRYLAALHDINPVYRSLRA